jgi:hypothetical protein
MAYQPQGHQGLPAKTWTMTWGTLTWQIAVHSSLAVNPLLDVQWSLTLKRGLVSYALLLCQHLDLGNSLSRPWVGIFNNIVQLLSDPSLLHFISVPWQWPAWAASVFVFFFLPHLTRGEQALSHLCPQLTHWHVALSKKGTGSQVHWQPQNRQCPSAISAEHSSGYVRRLIWCPGILVSHRYGVLKVYDKNENYI